MTNAEPTNPHFISKEDERDLKKLSDAQFSMLLSAQHITSRPIGGGESEPCDEVELYNAYGMNRKTRDALINKGITANGRTLTGKGRRLWVAAHKKSFGMTPTERAAHIQAERDKHDQERRAGAERIAAPVKGITIKPRNMTSFAGPDEELALDEAMAAALLKSTTITLSIDQVVAISEKLEAYRNTIKVLAS